MGQADTPKWMWGIGATLLVAVTAYAVYSRQTVRHLKFPGGEIQFGDAPSVADESVGFSISYDGATRVTRDGAVSVYIDGGEIARLSIGDGRPFQTVTARVPRAGTYAYRIDQVETQMLHPNDAPDPETLVPVRVTMSGEGKVDIQPGAAFKVIPILTGGPYGGWSTQLRAIVSEQEREEERERSRKALDDLIDAEGKPDQ